MTYSSPVSGYLFPSYEEPEYDIDAIISELAELEADPGSEAFDEAVDSLACLPEWEILSRYEDHRSEY